MSINTFEESILSLDEAANHVSNITKKKRNRHLIMRWINRGVSGVRLSSIRIGREVYTSREAINEFLNRANDAKREKRSKATAEGIRRAKLDRQLDRQLEQQAQELGI